jgi:hypothetical protein
VAFSFTVGEDGRITMIDLIGGPTAVESVKVTPY